VLCCLASSGVLGAFVLVLLARDAATHFTAHDSAWRGSLRLTMLLGEGVYGSRRCLVREITAHCTAG
jgi:hypothetical protein